MRHIYNNEVFFCKPWRRYSRSKRKNVKENVLKSCRHFCLSLSSCFTILLFGPVAKREVVLERTGVYNKTDKVRIKNLGHAKLFNTEVFHC